MVLRKADRGMTVSESAYWVSTFEEHGSSVMAFLTSRTGRREVAEDLLQETFIRVIRARPKLPDPASVRAYLFTTAHRLVISRARRKRPMLFSEVRGRDQLALGETVDTEAAAPDAAADLSRLKDRLQDVLLTLSRDHRTAFEMAVLQQRKYAEIAAEQGWSLAQVKTNVHRARKKVMGELKDLMCPGLENAS